MKKFIYIVVFLITSCYKINNFASLEKVNYSWELRAIESSDTGYASLEDNIKKGILEYVLKSGDSKGLQTLLNHEMDPDQEVEGGESSLIYLAAQEEFYPALASILIGAGANINHQDSGRRTPLFAAAWKGSEEALQYLLEKNAKLDVEDQVGRTALWIALDRGNKDCAEQLLKEGANPSISKKCGTSTLLIASKKGYKDIVEDLLKKGVNKKQINIKNEKPVIAAAIGGHKEIVEILKSEDDNFHMLDLLLSMDTGSESVSLGDILVNAVTGERKNDVEALLSLKINDPDNFQKAISASISQGSMDIGRMLLDKCKPQDFKDRGCGFLCSAVSKSKGRDLLTDLIAWGAACNVPELADGDHPLTLALFYKDKIAAISLLQAGADPNIVEPYGCDPIKWNVFLNLVKDFEVYQKALDCGLRWDDPDVSMEHAFNDLVEKNQVEILDDLIKKGVKLDEEEGDELIYRNAGTCSPAMLKLLLDNNMRIRLGKQGMLNAFIEHPVYRNVFKSDREDRYETLEVLLDRCWNVNDIDNLGQTIFNVDPCGNKVNRIFVSQGLRFKRGGNPIEKAGESADYKTTINLMKNLDFKVKSSDVEHAIFKSNWDAAIYLLESSNVDIDGSDIMACLMRRVSEDKDIDTSKVLRIARILVSMGAKVDFTENKRNPLHVSVAMGSEDMLSTLIEGGADVNVVNDTGQTPLHMAVKKSEASMVRRLLISGANVNAVNSMGDTPIMVAVREVITLEDMFIQKDEIVDILLEYRANTRIKNHDGENAAMVAAFSSVKSRKNNDRIESHNKKFIPKLSEESDGNIISNIISLKGVYGLDKQVKRRIKIAIEKGYFDDLDFLLELTPDNHKAVSFMFDALEGLSSGEVSKEVVRKLLAKKCFASYIPKQCEYGSGRFLIQTVVRYAPSMLEEFLDNGLDLGCLDENGRNCLSARIEEYFSSYAEAEERGKLWGWYQSDLKYKRNKILELIQMAPSIPVDPTSFSDCNDPRLAKIFSGTGIESFMDLAWSDDEFDEELANDLLKKSGDINQQDNRGRTPIFVAALLGKSEMVKFLASKGADINICDTNKMTPLEVAFKSEYEECAIEILNLGGYPRTGNVSDQMLLCSALSKLYDVSRGREKNFLFDALVKKLGDDRGLNDKFLKDLKQLFFVNKYLNFNTALKVPVSREKSDIARILLNLDCDLISCSGKVGVSISELFGYYGNIEDLLMLCLDKIEIPNIKLRLELIEKALMRGREKLFNRLVEGVDSFEVYNDIRPHPLALAVEHNLTNVADKILDLGADPNLCFVGGDENGENPLDLLNFDSYSLLATRGLDLVSPLVAGALPMLILRNQLDIVKDLLEKGVVFDSSRGRLGGSVARDLAEFGSIEMIELLSQYGLDMTTYEEEGDTFILPADVAIREGRFDIAKIMLESVDINEKNPDGETLLDRLGNSQGSVEFLLSQGASLTAGKVSLIHKACLNKEAGLVKLALDKDPNLIEARNEKGETPLLCALEANAFEIADELRNRGASLLAVDILGDNALMHLLRNQVRGFVEHESKEKEGDFMRYLSLILESSVDVNAQNANGDSALMLAAHYGLKESFSALLSHQANIHLLNRFRNNALISVFFSPRPGHDDGNCCNYRDDKNRLFIMKALINKGIDVNHKNVFGEDFQSAYKLSKYKEQRVRPFEFEEFMQNFEVPNVLRCFGHHLTGYLEKEDRRIVAALKAGSLDLAELLLELRESVGTPFPIEGYEDDLLHIAVVESSDRVIDWLMEKGFSSLSVQLEDWCGIQVEIRPLDLALLNNRKSAFEMMISSVEDKKKLIDSLLEKWLGLYESMQDMRYTKPSHLKVALSKIRRVIANLIKWTDVPESFSMRVSNMDESIKKLFSNDTDMQIDME